MLTTITYTCGLCGKSGDANYESSLVNKLESWVSLLHCNRCADFKVMLRKLRETCKNLTILRWQLQMAKGLTIDRDQTIKTQLTNLTRSIAKLTCLHWRIETIWEPEFVQQMLDFPDKTEFIVNQYAVLIKNQAQEFYAQARMSI